MTSIALSPVSVKVKLAEIIHRRFGITPQEWSEERMDCAFIGPEWQFTARDLVYLYVDVEREFDLSIPAEEVAKGNFNSFRHVERIILHEMEARLRSKRDA